MPATLTTADFNRDARVYRHGTHAERLRLEAKWGQRAAAFRADLSPLGLQIVAARQRFIAADPLNVAAYDAARLELKRLRALDK